MPFALEREIAVAKRGCALNLSSARSLEVGLGVADFSMLQRRREAKVIVILTMLGTLGIDKLF